MIPSSLKWSMAAKIKNKSSVSDQKCVSLLCIMLEIHHFGREPSKYTPKIPTKSKNNNNKTKIKKQNKTKHKKQTHQPINQPNKSPFEQTIDRT